MPKQSERTNVIWAKNKFYGHKSNSQELKFFRQDEIDKAYMFQKSHSLFNETPLHQLKNLAHYLNVQDIRVKDESYRFGLNAFKVLGGIFAVGKCLANKLGKNIEDLSFEALKESKDELGELTFISATDGNHGRGVAWAARELGHKSVIYMPKGSSLHRLEAISDEGAEAYIIDLNYDDAVRKCAQLSDEHGWIMVQDTAWEGYEEIPLWIMQGYGAMGKEIVDQLKKEEEQPPTHVFLQAGVGSYAAGVTAYLTQYYSDQPPAVIIVEPDQADCYYRSFSNPSGIRTTVSGDMNTIMAGLACGEPNTIAFNILRQYAKGAFSCQDQVASLGMRIYGNPLKGDPKVISGESGAVTLGLLHELQKNEAYLTIREELSLNSQSRILLINTEGDTDPDHYLEIVWKGLHSNVDQ